MEKNRTYGLQEIINQDSEVLILGTLPGKKSLDSKKYYSDSSNKFWSILFQACGEPIDKSDEAKEKLLKKYKIAFWDILESAIRNTSSDEDIEDEIPNDLPQLLEDYPNIKLILFHSNDAYKYFKRFFKNTTVPYIRISSPSGQNRKNIQEKILEWKAALSSVIPELQTEHRLELK